MPAKVAARSRPFDTGHARKTDAHDPHAIVMVALRTRGLRQLQVDEDLAVLRLLADRRDELSPTRAQNLNRLHRLLAELIGPAARNGTGCSTHATYSARGTRAHARCYSWPRGAPPTRSRRSRPDPSHRRMHADADSPIG